jgi:hypothetical protein
MGTTRNRIELLHCWNIGTNTNIMMDFIDPWLTRTHFITHRKSGKWTWRTDKPRQRPVLFEPIAHIELNSIISIHVNEIIVIKPIELWTWELAKVQQLDGEFFILTFSFLFVWGRSDCVHRKKGGDWRIRCFAELWETKINPNEDNGWRIMLHFRRRGRMGIKWNVWMIILRYSHQFEVLLDRDRVGVPHLEWWSSVMVCNQMLGTAPPSESKWRRRSESLMEFDLESLDCSHSQFWNLWLGSDWLFYDFAGFSHSVDILSELSSQVWESKDNSSEVNA